MEHGGYLKDHQHLRRRRRRSARRRAYRRRRRLTYALLFTLTIGPALFITLKVADWGPKSSSSNRSDSSLLDARASLSVDPAVVGSHPVYPYSVIPGGARSRSELRESLAHDLVAADHYADFDVARARVVRSPQEQLVYVSYRVRDEIYWTRKRLRIPKGEPLLTDGVHYARARCGNRLSMKPEERVSAYEPSPSAMETPVPELRPTPPALSPGNAPVIASLEGPFPAPPAPAGPAGSPPVGGFFVIPPVPPQPGSVFHGGAPSPAGFVVPPLPHVPPRRQHSKKPPPPQTPEPTTLLLVASGVVGVAYRAKSRRRIDGGLRP